MNKVVLSVLGIVLAALILITMALPRSNVTSQSPTETSAPAWPVIDPIFTGSDAINRSLTLFPATGDPHSSVARLVTRLTFEEWVEFQAMNTSQHATAAAQATMNWGSDNPSAPIWFVAILGTSIHVNDVLHPPGGIVVSDSRAADGAYYAWDAASGRLLEEGALVTGSPHSYTSIAAIPTATMTISTATPQPTWAPVTPVPSNTSNASSLATDAALVTAQATHQTKTPTLEP